MRRRLARACPGELESRLLAWTAESLVDRLDGIRVDPRAILVLGGREGVTSSRLRQLFPQASLVTAGLAPGGDVPFVVTELERLPWADGSFDLVLSPLLLHWSRDLPAALRQVRRVLAPGGLMLAVIPGEHTLGELRQCLEAEDEHVGRVWPRMLVLPEMKAFGDLVASAGFTMPVVDRDWLHLAPPDLGELLRAMRRLGSGNPHGERQPGLRGRGWLAALESRYRVLHSQADGSLLATVELLFVHGVKRGGEKGVSGL